MPAAPSAEGHAQARAGLRARAVELVRTLRALGWANGALYLLDRVLAVASGGRARIHKYYLVAQPVARRPLLPPRRGAGMEVRQLGPGDPLLAEFPRPAHAMPYRFDQGAVCLVLLNAGACAGFLWFTPGPYQEDEVRCRYVPLPEGKCSWDFDVYVDPRHRNGIAMLKLWDEANRVLAARGVEWSLSRISALNSGSLRAHERLGATRIGTVTFVCAGRFQASFSSLPPRFHWSARADSFPVLSLHAPRGGRED